MSLFNTTYHHTYTYDMNLWATILVYDPPLDNPVKTFPVATFYQQTEP
jgi:hypothetical protein